MDVGGTKTGIAALDAAGAIRLRRRVATPRDDAGVIGAVAALVAGAERELGRGSVGVGIPGSLSPATGRVRGANSTWLNGGRRDRGLAAALGCEGRVSNAADRLALSEAAAGSGDGLRAGGRPAQPAPMDALCRDCFATDPGEGAACRHCGARRVLRHAELFALHLAHVDCDAFYASVEKRDRPELRARPVIVGGGARGVVAAACYVARTHGVRSAMPMFKALAACPDAVVIKPDMAKYAAAARRIRALMERLTPLVQPLSIDEAVLDLAGTAALHQAPPAVVLARFAAEVEREVGVTVSIGLAANRLMAKLAAGRDKPRGFAVIGAGEAAAWLAPQRVGLLPGIGPAASRRLEAAGITRLGQLAALDARAALARLGAEGPALAARARGEDRRPVERGARRRA